MSINVVKEPATVDLSGSYLPLWLSSNDIYSSNGSAAELELTFSAIPSNGDDLTLSWNDGIDEVALGFSTAPNNTGEQIGITGASVADWLDNTCIPALQQNYDLDKHYTFSRSSNTLIITAKQVGTTYSLTVELNNTGATESNTAGVDPVFKSDFRILTILEYATMDAPSSIEVHEKVLNVVDDTAYFDLNDPLYYLHGKTLPDWNASAVKNTSANVLKYRPRYCEMYESESFTSKLQNGNWRYALPGGRQRERFIDNPNFFTQWFNTQQAVGTGDYISKFLTSRLNQKISQAQPVLLNYLHTLNRSTFIVKATLFYTDGTNSTATLYTVNPATHYNLYSIPVGYDRVESHITSGKTLSKYNIHIEEGAGLLSNTAVFTIDTEPSPDEKYLLFQNSFGVHEVYRFRGVFEEFSKFKHDPANKVLKYPTSKTNRKATALNNQYQDSYLLNTGYLTADEIDFFREVANSPDVFIGIDAWLPAMIKSAELPRAKTKSFKTNAATLEIQLDWDKIYMHA